MKFWLAYICILLFSLQVLPVKEIGGFLMKSQLIEKTCSDGDASDDNLPKLKKQKDSYYVNDPVLASVCTMLLTLRTRIAIEAAACLSQDYTADILTPPPDHL